MLSWRGMERMPLAAAEGLILLLRERSGVASFEDGSAAALHTIFTCDLSNGAGLSEGYWI